MSVLYGHNALVVVEEEKGARDAGTDSLALCLLKRGKVRKSAVPPFRSAPLTFGLIAGITNESMAPLLIIRKQVDEYGT
jgi:hypothetical protein